MTDTTTNSGPVTHTDRATVRSLTLRGLLLQGAFNYERFQNLGFWWILRPTLDRLYPGKQERAAAYQRHMAYFNTNAWVIGPIAGIVTAMEEQRSKGATDFDDEAINSVKVGLMAPLAGVGDSLIFGTIRPILAAVCAAMAVAGNIAAPIIFFLVLTATQVAMRVWGTTVGYRTGTRFLENLAPAQVDRIKQGAAVVGLAVTGALVATLLPVTTPLSYTSGGQTIALQKQLDSVLPTLLPLTATLVVYVLIRRRVSPLWVLLGTLVVGLLCGYFGILA